MGTSTYPAQSGHPCVRTRRPPAQALTGAEPPGPLCRRPAPLGLGMRARQAARRGGGSRLSNHQSPFPSVGSPAGRALTCGPMIGLTVERPTRHARAQRANIAAHIVQRSHEASLLLAGEPVDRRRRLGPRDAPIAPPDDLGRGVGGQPVPPAAERLKRFLEACERVGRGPSGCPAARLPPGRPVRPRRAPTRIRGDAVWCSCRPCSWRRAFGTMGFNARSEPCGAPCDPLPAAGPGWPPSLRRLSRRASPCACPRGASGRFTR